MVHIWKSIPKLLFLIVFSVVFSGCALLDRKNVGGLQVITHDSPSSLFLDGQYLDKTPFINEEIKPGTYTLRIEPDKKELLPYETVVTVRKGLLTVVTWKPGTKVETSGGVIYELEPIAGGKTELSFATIPDSAIIKIDEGEQQFSPLIVSDLSPGHHQYEVSLPSYESQKHTINVVKGLRIIVTVKLAKSGENTMETGSPTPSTTTELSATTTNTATPTARRRTAPSSEPTVTITKTNFFQNGEEVLRIRSLPNPSGKELGFAKVGSSYPYLNEEQNGWYKIDFNGQTGWASGQYAKLD